MNNTNEINLIKSFLLLFGILFSFSALSSFSAFVSVYFDLKKDDKKFVNFSINKRLKASNYSHKLHHKMEAKCE